MRNMLAFFAALLLTFAGLGWYLDWYSFRSTPAPSGQRSITIDINTKKIAEDALKAEKQIQEKLAEKAREGSKTPLSVPSEKKPANRQETDHFGVRFDDPNR